MGIHSTFILPSFIAVSAFSALYSSYLHLIIHYLSPALRIMSSQAPSISASGPSAQRIVVVQAAEKVEEATGCNASLIGIVFIVLLLLTGGGFLMCHFGVFGKGKPEEPSKDTVAQHYAPADLAQPSQVAPAKPVQRPNNSQPAAKDPALRARIQRELRRARRQPSRPSAPIIPDRTFSMQDLSGSPPPASPGTPALPKGWVETVGVNGQPSYLNSETGTTTDVRPEGAKTWYAIQKRVHDRQNARRRGPARTSQNRPGRLYIAPEDCGLTHLSEAEIRERYPGRAPELRPGDLYYHHLNGADGMIGNDPVRF